MAAEEEGGILLKKYMGLEDMSNVNCSSVLNVIRNCGAVSRKQISDITGLSWGGMTKIVNKLFHHGYIVEEKDESSSGVGRIPSLIRIDGSRNVVIGLDLNREGFRAYVMNLCGDVLKEYSSDVCYREKNELLDTILYFIGKIVQDYEEKNIMSIAAAMQGILDIDKGISIKFPHCPDWKNVPIRDIVEQEFGIDVFVEHDPNCMLYSRLSEEESENMLLFRLDRSIGMAVSVNGEILRGNGLLEVAHCIVVPEGKTCRCGQRGCIEAYLAPCLEGNAIQENALWELMDPLALLMNNMVRVFHSDTVILTGKLMKYSSIFEKKLLEHFYSYCEQSETKVKFAKESNLAVEGAARIAVQGAVDRIII